MKLIVEAASYAEFYKRYTDGKAFAIISVYQGDKTTSINDANTKSFRTKVSNMGYDYIRVMGKYAEDESPNEFTVVFCNETDVKDFIRFILFFAKKYHQNSVTIIDEDSNIWIYSTKTDGTYGGTGTKYLQSGKFQRYEIEDLILRQFKRTFEVNQIKVSVD